MKKQQLWQTDAVYQIYPRSFCDSNGDGIGDLPGIISKLDYLQDLGVKMIWLSPIYASPQFDIGYDISDYYKINPEYGTMEDFETLIAEAKNRGMRIIMDLVANHTSSEHEWFKQSKDPQSPYHDYYVWRKGKHNDGKVPPNNWTSNFSGSAWTYEPSTNLWYLHLFAPEQPDLNWHNEKVVEEVEKILRFYLDKGVYGFRCDVINQIWKQSYEDGKGHSPAGRGAEHYLMTEGNHKMLHRLYEEVYEDYPDHIVIGETASVDLQNGLRYLKDKELDMFFEFEHAAVDAWLMPVFKRKFKANRFKKILFSWQKNIPWNAVYLENHDQPRSISRFGDPKNHWKESGKALALFYLCLKGTPFVYNGQEIGMLNHPFRPSKESQDVSVHTVDSIMKGMGFIKPIRERLLHNFDRDHARTPVQWNDGVSGGFSSSEKTWIPVNPNCKSINVESQINDPSSLFSFYKALLHLRSEDPLLHDGEFQELPTSGDLIAYTRYVGTRSYMAVVNLGKKTISVPKYLQNISGEIKLSTLEDSSLENLKKLRPYEGMLILMRE